MATPTHLKQARIPALIPFQPADADGALYWAARAVNDQTILDTLTQELDRALRKEGTAAYTLQYALFFAREKAVTEVLRSVKLARENGGLLLAWHCSKALVPALPAGLEGGAA